MQCRISRSLLAAIQVEAADAAPHEACGLLFGTAREIVTAQRVANVADTPERNFEVDPSALFSALRAERAGGPALAGYWHSHPSGDASPSITDAEMAAPDGRLWLIVAGDAATLWCAVESGAVHDRFDPVAIV